ncbi:DUF1848 domain-containing protein [Oceanibacterium hippocampi]|uniref:DNA repair photolyase n=1 Tax=Oceanibacterium hippocampi TaxID=745714 RepID=A0A1Y5RMB3_9PROT|nr:DUF1848 domain-containing protein [Oceanibacterium hippocampi]SLN18109.1 hypothetical protein OCH7691_00371 [Oceanibacterium hippocampi]
MTILSASYRTDIPAFYADWFRRRFAAGSVDVLNPYGGRVQHLPLRGDGVTGYVFWTRNAAPFAGALEDVSAAGIPFYLQYSLTGYPRPLESSVPASAAAIEAIRRLSDRFGRRALVWRYDPVLLTSLTPAAVHRQRFAELARALNGIIDEVVLSFAQIYTKTRRNLDRAAARHDFGWQDPPADEKRALLAELGQIARNEGLTPTLCSQPELLTPPFAGAACIDGERLSDLAGRAIAVRRKGNRPGCLCAESRDIGAYDSCPHGCVYCYAVTSKDAVRKRRARHDPASSCLVPPTRPATTG